MDKNSVVDLKEWAEITMQRWEMRIAKLKFLPTHTGDLINSFRAHVEKDANGDVAKISFTFLYYGYYVDSGSGPRLPHTEEVVQQNLLARVQPTRPTDGRAIRSGMDRRSDEIY